jgi:hypothetical protein
MKTTIEIADDLFAEVQEMARKEKTTFRSLTESGLRLVMAAKAAQRQRKQVLPPLITAEGKLTPEFQNGTWDDMLEAAYPTPKR